MDRAQATGFGISAAAHIALFAALSLGLAVTTLPPPRTQPIEVSFVKDVGLVNAAPRPSPAPPAQSVAPEAGPPEEAAPVPAEAAKPPPLPAPPPRPVPKPAEVPAPAKPATAKPATAKPVPIKPATVKPATAKPATAKPAAAKPVPARPAARPAPVKAAPAAAAPATPGAGVAAATRGSRLGRDFLKGVGSDPSPSRAQQPPAAVMSADALAGIQAAIKRQIQPCADRQVNPGPGASAIRVKLNLHLNRDGSLARTPAVVSTEGVTSENGRYEDRVKDLAVAAYVGCSPLHGLPDELYQTPKGGWANFTMTYKLP